jgi:peptide-methionine (S)-S-oxide reductase
METKTKKLQVATFAAGCFWHVEEAFRKVKGVKSTEVGYIGGTMKNPSYEDVCNDKTGHAEAVQVIFDPNEISYEQLLEIFWSIHNPTQLNRQGPDIGTQYRSVIFFHNKEQQKAAERSLKNLAKKMKVVTEIVPATEFYKAEEYHQKYMVKRSFTCTG